MYLFTFFVFPLDKYIGVRYNKYNRSRYIVTRHNGGEYPMNNPALTEAVYYILLSLLEPMHGYGIMQNVEKMSHGRVKLAAGTLYGAISSMLEKGWIYAISENDSSIIRDSRGKKEYKITAEGREVLKNELLRLTELLENGAKILEGKNK